ncbi:hypothetical protein GCM10007881_31030 [Mesorhizobium huakuii]|nr:hypothetical protein GCM10007881_31030 [Mesorhizobium huakuii]
MLVKLLIVGIDTFIALPLAGHGTIGPPIRVLPILSKCAARLGDPWAKKSFQPVEGHDSL